MNKNSKAGKAIPFSSDANENDITSFFECPVCFDYVLPPIYQCRSGHLVCSSCRVNLKCCPTCRGPLGNIRNLAMEKVASTILFPCKFNNSGCTKSLSHTEKLEHEEICEYRPYVCPCPGASCKWQGSLEQVMSHLLVSHKTITTLQGEDIVFLATDITLPGNVDWVMMQSCFGHYFILVLEKQERNVATIMPQSAASAGSGGGGGSSSNQNSSLTGNITGSSHLAHLGNEGAMSGGHATTGNMLNPVGSNLSGMNASALGIHSGSLSTSSSATAPLQQFYAVVQIIGSRKQAENFAYKLELNGNNRRLTWEARPRSVHEGVSSAISKCDCLVFESGVAALFSENGNLAINVTITLTSSSSSSSINNNNKSSSPTNALSFSNNNNNNSSGGLNNNNITGAPGTGGSSSGYLGGGGGCCGGAHNHPSNTGSGGGGNGFINHSSETSFSPPPNISSSPSICPPNYHPPQQQKQLNCHYLDDKSSTSAAAKGSSLMVPGVSEPDQNAFTPPPLLNSNTSSTYLPQQQQQHYFYQTINNNNNTHNNNNSKDIACGNNDTCNGTSYHHHHYPFNHLLASPSTNNNCGGGGVGNLFTSFSSNNHLHHFVGGHSGHHLASASAGNAIP